MNDISKFWQLARTVEENEKKKKDATAALEEAYADFVQVCPHPEALDWNYGNRGGDYRVCIVCGLTDYASEGGTPGDEYNYGYPGSPNKEFWKNTKVRRAESETEHWKYRNSHDHGWVVKGGEVVNRFG